MNDLISRQAAIDALVKHSYLIRYDFGFTSIENGMTITGIKQALSELPSAERHAHWVAHRYTGGLYFRCSNCRNDGSGMYCSNCGAKMDEEASG